MVPAYRTFHILAEVQKHIYILIKVDQFIIAHMFQVKLLNIVLKVSTIQHAVQE